MKGSLMISLAALTGVVSLSSCTRSSVLPSTDAIPNTPANALPGVVRVRPGRFPRRYPQRFPQYAVPRPDNNRWKPKATQRNWESIVIHHTAASSGNVQSIHEAHLRRKDKNGIHWQGIGYHFVIGNGNGMPDGKKPIVVADSPGFVVNRLLLPYLNESVELLLEGVPVESIETAAQIFGMPMGPLTQLDAIGVDVALRAGTTLYTAFPERVVSSDVMIGLFEAGQLGRKSGAGFFCYENERPSTAISPKAEERIAERRRPAATFTQEHIIHRLFLPMLLEATRVLEEDLVDGAAEVDTAVIDGIAFPASKGGVLGWADALGAANVVEMLKPYEHLGARYHPTETLLRAAGNNLRFYA